MKVRLRASLHRRLVGQTRFVYPLLLPLMDPPFIGIDAKVCGRPVIVPFMGGTPNQRPVAYHNATPASHLPLGIPQVFVLGELAPFMVDYVAAAKSAGDPVFVFEPAGADHFDIITPGTANGTKVIDFVASRLRSY